MAELKPGGLALVIRGEDCGKCVTTERYIQGGSSFKGPCGRMFTAADKGGGWLCTGDIHAKDRPELKGWAIYWAENLMPIDGDDFQHEDERKKELSDA